MNELTDELRADVRACAEAVRRGAATYYGWEIVDAAERVLAWVGEVENVLQVLKNPSLWPHMGHVRATPASTTADIDLYDNEYMDVTERRSVEAEQAEYEKWAGSHD